MEFTLAGTSPFCLVFTMAPPVRCETRFLPRASARRPPALFLPLFPIIHRCRRTASTAGVHADGCLTFSLLNPPISLVLPQCVGRRANCRTVRTLIRLKVRLPARGGSRPSLRLPLSLLLAALWHIPRKFLNPTILFAVMNMVLRLLTLTAVAAPLTLVLVTREVTACP